MAREKGKVKWFSERKGYGFIERESGEDAFVHFSEIEGSGYRWLREEEEVEFEVVQDSRGPKAVNVERLGEAPGPTVSQGRVRTLSESRAQMRETKRRLAEQLREDEEDAGEAEEREA